jgi:uncharacterized membrane protein
MTEQPGGPPPSGQQPSAPPSGNKTSTGLQENVAGFLCYLGWWITGIIFLFIEKENKTIRFHAIQSICVLGFFWVLWAIFFWVPFLNFVIWAVGGILWIVLMVTAYQGKKVKMPWVGNFAEKRS